MGGTWGGGEENNTPAKHNGQSGLLYDKDDYGVHERAVEFIIGACDGRIRCDFVCGGCFLIDKYRLKLMFSRHAFKLKELKDKTDRLKELSVEIYLSKKYYELSYYFILYLK